jgi:hypothetical protein
MLMFMHSRKYNALHSSINDLGRMCMYVCMYVCTYVQAPRLTSFAHARICRLIFRNETRLHLRGISQLFLLVHMSATFAAVLLPAVYVHTYITQYLTMFGNVFNPKSYVCIVIRGILQCLYIHRYIHTYDYAFS